MNVNPPRFLSFGLRLNTVGFLLVAFALGGCANDDDSRTAAPRPANGSDQSGAGSPNRQTSPNTVPAPTFELNVAAVDDDPTDVWITVKSAEPGVWSKVDVQNEDALRAALVFHLKLPHDDRGTESATPQPTIGKFDVTGDTLRFRPAFPLIPGETYSARFDPNQLPGLQDNGGQPLDATYSVPMAAATTPRVTNVFPSGNIVPANHLKFYILFSEPMQRDGIFEHFRLIDLATDKAVPRPFRHVELWSKDNKRLTLWFHPGRQKQGVNLNVEIGPVLKTDGKYRLEISGGWKSEKGVALGEIVTKMLRVAPPDHRQPEPKTWFLSNPRAASSDFLTCDFHEPLDWALLHSELSVETAAGKRVPGRVELGYGELSWFFHPKQPWKPGEYRVAVGQLLEDLAGNSIERLFEVDVTNRPAKSVGKTVYLEFEILPPSPPTR
jgi:hypothetical protein